MPIAVRILAIALLLSAAAQAQQTQAIDGNGAPVFRVDPFWPQPLPNRWSMQQVTGIYVDHRDHIWFLNRLNGAEGDEIGAEVDPPRLDCCVAGPELIELDQEGNVVNAFGGPGYHPKWPANYDCIMQYIWTDRPP